MKKFDQLFFTRGLESWEGMKINEFIDFLLPKCQEIITLDKLRHKMDKTPTLRIKFGIDPTASEIHLGHIVPIMLLRQFAKAGHNIDFIVGDFTAQIGDPSARDTGRIPLAPKQILKNMETYSEQIGRYLDLKKINLRYNSEWLNIMTLQEIFVIFQQINLSEATQREDFRTRKNNNQAVSLAEVCYGMLMGIDSMHLKSDVEIGGIDQLLNFQQCRKLMQKSGIEEEIIMMTPILEGTSGDGKKMSKSYGNYIPINSSLQDKFGRIMSIPDRLIGLYFRCFSDVRRQELSNLDMFIKMNPLEAKKQLATLLVGTETKLFEDGLRERESFERKFSLKKIQKKDCIELNEADIPILDALIKSGQFKSKSELNRLFKQQAVNFLKEGKKSKLNSEATVRQVCDGIVQVGKRYFFHFNLN